MSKGYVDAALRMMEFQPLAAGGRRMSRNEVFVQSKPGELSTAITSQLLGVPARKLGCCRVPALV